MPPQNILYIGPYREDSNRGYYSYYNIKGLIKGGHNIKTIPRFSNRYINNRISDDIVHLENNNLDYYDVCIQHSDSLQYSYNKSFKTNIGIYDVANFDPNPIVNADFFLLDKIVISSRNKFPILQEVLSLQNYNKLVYLPQLADFDEIQNQETNNLQWMENRFYFYSELDFSDQYDWEKLIYVYLTTFMNKNTGLVIKTKNLTDPKKIELIKKQIYDIAKEANIKPVPRAMPQVLNNAFNKKELATIYKNTDCFIDINKANEQSYAAIHFAALDKPIICNSYLTTASYFREAIKTEGMICNSSMGYYEDISNASLYNYYYTINTESLREAMLGTYSNQYSKNTNLYGELDNHNVTKINEIL